LLRKHPDKDQDVAVPGDELDDVVYFRSHAELIVKGESRLRFAFSVWQWFQPR
jgi:hypothetical protein